MPDNDTDATPLEVGGMKGRKPVYLALAGGMAVLAIVLLVWAFSAMKDHEDRRLAAHNTIVLAEKILRDSHDAGKKELAQREIAAAELIEAGSHSMMIGLFAAAGGVLIMAIGFLAMAFQKPKVPVVHRRGGRRRF